MDSKVVLVTGIGGNVGQGIIRNIRETKFPIRIIGCNISEFSAGNHLCDYSYTTPYAYDQEYISRIIEIVVKEKVDLIIPSTDYEVYYLAVNKDDIPCEIAVSSADTAGIYLDKYKTFLHFRLHDIPFSESFLPSNYSGKYENIILKPREGRGSRGISVNPANWKNYSDEYMIQKLHVGKEITTAFYVDKAKRLHGFITLERQLANGATNECRVNFDFDEGLRNILLKLIKNTDIRGSANLQSIVDDEGNIHPFEVNCRISGTNSIRSNFGFEDVKYTLEEYLYKIEPSIPAIKPGVAVRIMMDIIYPNKSDTSKLNNNKAEHYIF